MQAWPAGTDQTRVPTQSLIGAQQSSGCFPQLWECIITMLCSHCPGRVSQHDHHTYTPVPTQQGSKWVMEELLVAGEHGIACV